MAFCNACGKRESRNRTISSESKLCSDCSTSTSNEVQINPPGNPDDTLGNIKFCDFIT